ncbi:DNA-binding protein [Undibacterium sp. Xuan67W]|uniref:DNA-binding protein n=1 Tax=Undibacterium sp. Xuan67W TaxID=3413057 RepID=UPI003BF4033B
MEDFINENKLIAEIDQLRTQFPDTQDLYREVCTLLFFRYGITPTANKLYQLVRKGSMSAPADALSKFWSNLRDKSRVRIEHPDLPETLKIATADLVATIWNTAQEEAHGSLASYRIVSDEAVLAAQTAQDGVVKSLEIAELDKQHLSEELSRALELNLNLQQQLTAVNTIKAGLELQILDVKADASSQQVRLKELTQDFTQELEKQRHALQLAEERFRTSETRALLEIDRERVQSSKLQKEIEQARLSALELNNRHQDELRRLQLSMGEYRQQIGSLQGSLEVITQSRDSSHKELVALRIRMEELQASLAFVKSESDGRLQQLSEIRNSEKKVATKPTRKNRKSDLAS